MLIKLVDNKLVLYVQLYFVDILIIIGIKLDTTNELFTILEKIRVKNNKQAVKNDLLLYLDSNLVIYILVCVFLNNIFIIDKLYNNIKIGLNELDKIKLIFLISYTEKDIKNKALKLYNNNILSNKSIINNIKYINSNKIEYQNIKI